MARFLYGSVNLFKTVYSYAVSSLTGRVRGRWMPPALSVELTNRCNLKCPECLTGSGLMTRPAGFMETALFRRILSETGPYLFHLNLCFQGESMMHPEFFEFLRLSKHLPTTVSTNGHFINAGNAGLLAGSGLKKLIVSLDGMTATSYGAYRKGGDFDTVTDGIRYLASEIKSKRAPLKLEIQFLVNRINEHETDAVGRFANGIKAGLKLKSMQIIISEDAESWLPSNERFRRYICNNGAWHIKSQLPGRCLRLWTSPVITWDGKVVPCCFDKNAGHVMGDLAESSFRDIWQGESFNEFRQALLNNRKEIQICRNCTSGLKSVAY